MKLCEISTLSDDIILHEEQMNLWEMASLRSKTTGIDDIVIWVSSGESVKHGPRIKVVRGNKWRNDKNATIPLTGMPRVIGDIGITQDEFSKIVRWIQLNRAPLIHYWNSDIDTADLINQLTPID